MNMRTLAASALLAAILSILPASVRASGSSPTQQQIYALQLEFGHALMGLSAGRVDPSGASRVAESDRDLDRLRELTAQTQDGEGLKVSALAGLQAALRSSRQSALAGQPLPKAFLGSALSPIRWDAEPVADDLNACRAAIEHDLTQPIALRLGRDGVVWIRITAPSAGTFAFDTFITEFDTRLSLYRDCREIDLAPDISSDDALGLGSVVGFSAKSAGESRVVKLERLGGLGELAVVKGALSSSISGTVTREDTGAPVNALNVSAFFGNSYYTTSQTDQAGHYQLYLYEVGDYRIRTSNYYYQSNSELIHEAYPNAPCVDDYPYSLGSCVGAIQALTLTDGQALSGIDIALGRGGSIVGRLTREGTTTPIAGATATAIMVSPPGGQAVQRVAYSDANGRFRIDHLAAASWRVEFNDSAHVRERWNNLTCGSTQGSELCPDTSGDEIALTSQQVVTIDASLTPFVVLPIHVSEAGTPLPASVSLYSANGIHFGEYSGGSDGVVNLGPLADGDYRIVVSAVDHMPRVFGGPECFSDCYAQLFQGTVIHMPQPPNTTLEVSLKPLPQLTGAARNETTGLPISGASVRVYRPTYSTSYAVTTTTTDADGQFTSSRLVPGTYFVHVVASGYGDELFADVPCNAENPLQDCANAMPIVVSTFAPLAPIEVSLRPSGGISGTVRALDITLPTSVVPSQVTLLRLAANGATISSSYLMPSADGVYLSQEVPPGQHRFGLAAYGYRTQLYAGVDCSPGSFVNNFTCPIGMATPLSWLGPELVDSINFNLTPNFSRRVRVIDHITLQPIPGVAVDQWSLDGNWRSSSITNAQGIALIKATNPYYDDPASLAAFVTTDNSLGYVDQIYEAGHCAIGTSAYQGNCSLSSAIPVPMSDGNNTPYPPIEFRLQSAVALFSAGFE